jgi:hypothetical protein
MEHDPNFDFPSDLLNTAFDGGSDVSSLPDSIPYQDEFVNEPPTPAKLAMIQSAQALLADAERRLMRFQNKKVYASTAERLIKLKELEDGVLEAQRWLNTLVNS